MPRPPLPKIVTHPLELRARSLRILLEIVREKYPAHWHDLIDAARAALGKTETLLGVIERWLRARRMFDDEGIAVFAALKLLAENIDELNHGEAVKALMWADLRGYIPRSHPPQPVTLKCRYLIGDGMSFVFGLQFEKMRAHILADFSAKLDDALAEYRRNCEAARLVEQPVSPAERERLEWLARHLVEGRSVPALAREKNHEYEALRKALAEAARACGLHLRRCGPKPVK